MSNLLHMHEDIFSPELLEKLFVFTRDGKQPTRTNFFNWKHELTSMSNAIFKFELDDNLKNEVEKELLEKMVLPKKTKVAHFGIQLYSRMSYIPWHNDGHIVYSVTIFLNKEWDKNWGGMYLYEDENEIKAIVPKYNTGVCYKTPLEHAVSLTGISVPFRETIQIFVDEFED